MNRFLRCFIIVLVCLLPARSFGSTGQIASPDSLQKAHDTATSIAISATGSHHSPPSVYAFSDQSMKPQFRAVSVARGLLGIWTFIMIAWLLSRNRKKISWKLVFAGLLVQLLLAVSILYFEPVRMLFEYTGKGFIKILDFTRAGSEFVFGGLVDVKSFGFVFAFQVLPIIIFFGALMGLFFYLRIIQRVVYFLAWLLSKSFRLSGAESLAVAGTIFLGQSETPLMIKGYLESMNRSEVMMLMTAGMSMMAGSVLAAYINFLGGNDPVQQLIFAKHLLAASVMAAPGAVVVSKILIPQVEEINTRLTVPEQKIGNNLFDALAIGTNDGIKMAVTVGGMLIVFIALIALMNYILGKLGQLGHLNDLIVKDTAGHFKGLSLQLILGYAFAPVVWLTGICKQDVLLVGRLLGEKIILTEFIGYKSLSELKEAGAFMQERTVIIATYILCGFANFASMGIQVGGTGAIAPGIRKYLSSNAWLALAGGTITSLISATIVGMILG